MVSKKQEFALAFFGLATVLIAFTALLYQNTTIALVAAGCAIIAMVMTIAFVYTEDEKLQAEIEQMAKERKGKSRKSR